MKKVVAIQGNPEFTVPEDYFDFDGWDDFIIIGGRYFTDFHTDYPLYDRIYRYCIDYPELQNAIDDAGKTWWDGSYTHEPDYKNATEAIKDMLEFTPTKMQVHKIIECLNKPDSSACNSYYRDNERIAELLSICERREWTVGSMHGCSQGDCVEIIYPEKCYNDDFINYIESVYFNTGEEYLICENQEPHYDEDGELNISPCDYDGYWDYFQTNLTWNDDLLKKRIAEDTGADEVILCRIDGYYNTIKYEVA